MHDATDCTCGPSRTYSLWWTEQIEFNSNHISSADIGTDGDRSSVRNIIAWYIPSIYWSTVSIWSTYWFQNTALLILCIIPTCQSIWFIDVLTVPLVMTISIYWSENLDLEWSGQTSAKCNLLLCSLTKGRHIVRLLFLFLIKYDSIRPAAVQSPGIASDQLHSHR